MRNPSLRGIGVALAVVMCLFVSVAAVDAAPCVSRAGGCEATVTFTPFNGTPTIICPNWGTVYTITVSFKCSPFGPPIVESDLVCSETALPVSFDVNGTTHIFYPDNPSDWGDVVADCDNLNHKVD